MHALKPAISQPEDVVEPVKNHFVMRDADDRCILIDRELMQQVHDDSAALRIERRGAATKTDTGICTNSRANARRRSK